MFTTTPYVPKKLINLQSWLLHIAKAIYAAEELKIAMPVWFDENVLKVGRQRYYEDYHYKELRDEIDSLHGDMNF